MSKNSIFNESGKIKQIIEGDVGTITHPGFEYGDCVKPEDLNVIIGKVYLVTEENNQNQQEQNAREFYRSITDRPSFLFETDTMPVTIRVTFGIYESYRHNDRVLWGEKVIPLLIKNLAYGMGFDDYNKDGKTFSFYWVYAECLDCEY